jgi:hypothetical protein
MVKEFLSIFGRLNLIMSAVIRALVASDIAALIK